MKIVIRLLPVIIFGFLSFVIIFPLLPAGYILTLDTILTPKGYPAPDFFSPSFIFSSFIFLLNLIIPAYFIQKIIIFLIFFLSGWGMFRLVKTEFLPAKIFAGLFYAVNPFVYERVMAGQWNLLLGYSLFPFFVDSLINFFHHPAKKEAVKLAVFVTVIISVVIHYSLILAVFLIIFSVIYLLFYQEKIVLIARNTVLLLVLVLILNANWLIPSVLGSGNISQNINSFSHEDLIAFQSVEDKNFGLVFNLLSGYGFWGEVYDYFLSPKNIVIIWPVISVVIILLSVYGLFGEIKKKDNSDYPLIISLLILFFLSLDLSGGVALKSIASAIFALYDQFPFLRGFREPQKLVGIVMFTYAYLGGIGFDLLLSKIKKGLSFFVICSLFFVLPVIYTPTVFGGFWGQLKPVFYPESWKQVNQLLNKDQDNFLVAVFPWHQYMKFAFNNNRIVANPAPDYFDKPVISSQNYETTPLYTHDNREEALQIDGLLRIQQEGVNLLGDFVEEPVDWGQGLTAVDIKYTILFKDADFQTYDFLDTTLDLEKIFDSEEIALYQNLGWGQTEEIPGWTEY